MLTCLQQCLRNHPTSVHRNIKGVSQTEKKAETYLFNVIDMWRQIDMRQVPIQCWAARATSYSVPTPVVTFPSRCPDRLAAV